MSDILTQYEAAKKRYLDAIQEAVVSVRAAQEELERLIAEHKKETPKVDL